MAPASNLSLELPIRIIKNLILFLIIIGSASSHLRDSTEGGRHSGHTHHIPKKDTPENLLKNREFIRDYEHIKEDLRELYDGNFDASLDAEALESYYFQIHDLDHDGKLDGLEILAAINHIMGREKQQLGIPEEKEAHILVQRWWNNQFDEDSEHIDAVLKDEDLDGDGFISYLEYSIVRERDKDL